MSNVELTQPKHNVPPLPGLQILRRDIRVAGRLEQLPPLLEKVIDSIQTQFVENYSTFTGQKEVILPYSRISSRKLLRDVFGVEPPPSQEKTLATFFPGFGNHPPDGVRQAVPSVFEYVADQGKTLPETDFIFLGYPQNTGGKITTAWLTELTAKGFSYYGQTMAELIKHLVVNNNGAAITQIAHNGKSMGTYVASHAAGFLKDFDIPQSVKNINPPGSHKTNGAHRKGQGGLPLALGFGLELVGKILKNKLDGRPSISSLDDKFFEGLREARGITTDDSPEQIRLRKLLKLTEIRLLVEKPPLPNSGHVTNIDQGAFDLLHFFGVVRNIVDFSRSSTRVQPLEGFNGTRRLVGTFHSPRSYTPDVVRRILATANGADEVGIPSPVDRREKLKLRRQLRKRLAGW